MNHKEITIELEEQDNGNWIGGICELDQPVFPLIAFPGEGKFGKYLSLCESLTEEQREQGIKAKLFGFLNFKTRNKNKDNTPFLTLSSRGFKWKGIYMPIQGIVQQREGAPSSIKLKFDNYYYDSQREFWEGKHEYVFSSDEEPSKIDAPPSIEEECPF